MGSTIVAQKLVDAKVAGVVGHLNSGTTIPASKIYFDRRNSADLRLRRPTRNIRSKASSTAFRVMANDVQQGKVLGEYAAKQLAAKTVAIIDDCIGVRPGPRRRI